MAEFHSWLSYWNFERTTKFNNRFVRDPITEEFLNTLFSTSLSRKKTIPKDRYLWRSQIGYMTENHDDVEEPIALPPQRMKPLEKIAREGRANPKGIPYLYCSTDKNTAMAESRPWIGSLISVGQFKTQNSLKVVDCSSDEQDMNVYFEEPDAKARELAVWSDINRAFYTPVFADELTPDYAPTQIIAELFKNAGFDGLSYKSALGTGRNIVLFNLASANLVNCFLYELKSLTFQFREAANPYFISQQNSKATTSKNEI